MALIVSCACGERVEADDSQAGQEVPCAACGMPVPLPVSAYNPLSTARYLQPSAEAPPQEEVRRPGTECPDCVATGQCHYCHGSGRLKEPFLERITNGISNAIAGTFRTIGDLLGAGPSEGRRRVLTRSERRRAGACPRCEGSGKCFKCEGTGQFTE
jgi:hypothetical protein